MIENPYQSPCESGATNAFGAHVLAPIASCLGLIENHDTAFRIRDKMRELQPDDPHLGACEVWLLARRLPDFGQETDEREPQ